MWKSIIRTTLILTIFVTNTAFRTVPTQSGGDGLYIPETGHWIRGAYLEMYQSADNPLLIFGYPITDEIIDPIDGQQTQYFEKARFDLVVQGDTASVEIAPLGDLLYTADENEVSLATQSQACSTFKLTGKSVCFAFLDFYKAHDGEIYFGLPISNLEYVDGRYVQYFENSRFEWRPESIAGRRVALTNLGEQYFDTRLGDLTTLNPTGTSDTPNEMVQLVAHAFVAKSLIPANSHQELYVTVQDQNMNPVPGAMVNVTILLPDGGIESYRPGVSNGNGISTLEFEVGNEPVNEMVQVEVQVSSKGFSTNTSTWFRIWY
jgi:hypothetical protein